MRTPILVLLLMVLTACGGSPATSRVCSPLDGATVDVSAVAVGTFQATVTGESNGSFSGEASFVRSEDNGYLLNLSGTEGLVGTTVHLALPMGITPGRCPPQSYDSALDPTQPVIRAVGVDFSMLTPEGYLIDFNSLSESSLILQSIEPLTGQFSFKATSADGKSVTVTGSFNQIEQVQE